jgi:putative endopeptidase
MRIWFLVVALWAGCQRKSPPPIAPDPAPVAVNQVQSGIDETAIDVDINPCDDFYGYACGNWLAHTELPVGVNVVDRFTVIRDRNLAQERDLLDRIGKGGEEGGKFGAKLGPFFSACMDEAAIEQSAPGLLQQRLARIDALKSLPQLAVEIAREHRDGVESLFAIKVQEDAAAAPRRVVALFDQGGLALPGADEYLEKEPKYVSLRAGYRLHIERMLVLAGEPLAQARGDAATILQIETGLASIWMTGAEDGSDSNPYDDVTQLDGPKSSFKFKDYLHYLGVTADKPTRVAAPLFFGRLDAQLKSRALPAWKAYLRWHLVHSLAPMLSKAFVDEDFSFFGNVLHAIETADPRWQQCVKGTDRVLGYALGEAFAQQTLGATGKEEALAIARGVQGALKSELGTLPWMDDATRQKARAKLDRIEQRIGYPDGELDHGTLVQNSDSYLQNVERARSFEFDRALRQLGQPLGRGQWDVTAASVFGRYEPAPNALAFTAGILQPPLFDPKAPPAVRFGAIGSLMAHELIQALDPVEESRDADGNPQSWWTAELDPQHKERAKCFVDQFNDYKLSGGGHIDGFATLGENIADAGGIKLAHAAYVATRGAAPPAPVKIGRWSDEQLFFLGAAQTRCQSTRSPAPAVAESGAHSLSYHRVNGTLANVREFAAAFACKAGAPMVRANACQLW